jgi:hypothetical protein
MPRQEIERLYSVLSRYRTPRQLEGCPCCTSPTEGDALIRKPLRTLTAPELEHYAFKALTTWGSIEDYKYFLPRIIELTAEGSLLCDIEITLGKLQYGSFHEWPADEQQAVRDFVVAEWQEAVQSADTDRADAVLCRASSLLEDVSQLLDYADTVAPDFKYAYAIDHSNQTKLKLINSFWEHGTPNYQRVVSWLYPHTADETR